MKRIEAEVAAEIKRIEAWNRFNLSKTDGSNPLVGWQIDSLANHLVRNRMQVEEGQNHALLEAATPLALVANAFDSCMFSDEHMLTLLWDSGGATSITVGQLRALAAAIALNEGRTT